MNDFQIRNVLIKDIRKKYQSTERIKNVIVQEMVLCRGVARIDVALVNGAMHGYEIKSSEDTLIRLQNQIEYYSRCFDYLTVVASEKHIDSILSHYPDWLGVSVAYESRNCLFIKKLRKASKNENLNIFSLMQLLWRNELLAIANLYKKDNKFSSLNKNQIIENLVLNFNKSDLQNQVRNFLKQRTTWAIAEVA